jgi:hypothetical protein
MLIFIGWFARMLTIATSFLSIFFASPPMMLHSSGQAQETKKEPDFEYSPKSDGALI